MSRTAPILAARMRAAAVSTGLALAALSGIGLPAASAAEAEPVLLPTADPCAECARQARPSAADGAAAVQGLPATPQPAGPSRFLLTGVRFSGAQALSAQDLDRFAATYVGRQVSLGDLETLAQAITARYRELGFFLAQAVVPVQTVSGGVVEISVVEGRMGRIEVLVAPDTRMDEARVRRFLAPVQVGQAVHAPAYERAMLLLSDQPGIRVSSGLEEGQETGTTDLTVEVAPGPRVSFAAEADNQGTRELGRYRAGGTMRVLSPFGIGDNFDLRALVSNGAGLQYGRASYEAPLGTNGLRAGIGLGRVSYELGGAFAALGARGTADVADVSLNYPVIRQRQQNLFLRLSFENKRLTDEFRAVSFESKKRIEGAGLGWTWERRDDLLGGGYFASSGTLYRGNLSILDGQSLAFDQGAAGHATDGGYTKLSFAISRLQSVLARQSLYLALGVQRASGNLDTSERLALGGARAVRAYAAGEALVDQGQVFNAEWRWTYDDELTPFVFYDAAHGSLVRRPNAFDGTNGISLRGYGLGLAWSRPGSFSVNATVAWRDGTRAAVTDGGGRNPRFYVQLQKVF